MKTVFFNLADEHALGDKAVTALRRQREREVFQFNYLEQARSFKSGQPFLMPPGPTILDNNINFIIAAHGVEGDTESIYYETDLNHPLSHLLKFTELAHFFEKIITFWKFPNNNSNIEITLAVCNAGRTSNHSENHITHSESLNFEDTFAFKFTYALQKRLSELGRVNKIIVHAYTGAVSFNEYNGNLEVQTEERREQDLKNNKLLQSMQKLYDQFELDVQSRNNNEGELVLQYEQKYSLLLDEKVSLSKTILPPKANYGEVIYSHDSRGQIVIDKTRLNKADAILGRPSSATVQQNTENQPQASSWTPPRHRSPPPPDCCTCLTI